MVAAIAGTPVGPTLVGATRADDETREGEVVRDHTERGKCLVLMCVMAVLAVAGSLLVSSSAEAASTVRVMPLGDSITGSPGCWRALLWQHLQQTGHTNVDFVGTLNNATSCGTTFDGDNEGHGGYLATGIVSNNQLPGWLSATPPTSS